MNLHTEIERQQAIAYVKGRLAKLSEWRVDLLERPDGPARTPSAEVRILDSKIDCLLDILNKLEEPRAPRAGGGSSSDVRATSRKTL